jgi:hypothetical protein
MENLTPLQQRAQQLREDNKRAESDNYKKQQEKLVVENRELLNRFSSSFSTLYSLLIGSNVQVRAEANAANPVIVLTCNGHKVTICFEQIPEPDHYFSWSLCGRIFKATLPSKELGVTADREDEDKLIIALEELLFNPQPVIS